MRSTSDARRVGILFWLVLYTTALGVELRYGGIDRPRLKFSKVEQRHSMAEVVFDIEVRL